MTTAKHTPTPWHLSIDNEIEESQSPHRILCQSLLHRDNEILIEEQKANAALIVKAVNAHDELVAAIKVLRSDVQMMADFNRNRPASKQTATRAVISGWDYHLDAANEVLAKLNAQ